MERHHKETIENIARLLRNDECVIALILGGSIAHGFASPSSDVDVCIVVDDHAFARRKAEDKLVYNNRDPEIVTYEGGYVDGKYVNKGFLTAVAEKGSDAIRYSFKDNVTLFSHDPQVEALLHRIVRFPIEKKTERLERFVAQVLAWKWYYGEALKKQNPYLVYLAIQKIVLFSGRIVLTANHMLYPYHKWLLAELAKAEQAPEHFLADIQVLLKNPGEEIVAKFCERVIGFVGYDEGTYFWPDRFMRDSEQNWISHEAPIDDL